MAIKFSQRSLIILDTVDDPLKRVVLRAATLAPPEDDFSVAEGVRSRERMMETWGQGRTVAQCRAAGVLPIYAKPMMPKVTWLRDPFASNHRARANGKSKAVDLHIYPIDWSAGSTPRWNRLALIMFRAAAIEQVAIRWGADWDGDGNYREKGEFDSPHYELVE